MSDWPLVDGMDGFLASDLESADVWLARYEAALRGARCIDTAVRVRDLRGRLSARAQTYRAICEQMRREECVGDETFDRIHGGE